MDRFMFWTNSDLQQHLNPCDFYGANMSFKVVLIDATTYGKYKNEDLSKYENLVKLLRQDNVVLD